MKFKRFMKELDKLLFPPKPIEFTVTGEEEFPNFPSQHQDQIDAMTYLWNYLDKRDNMATQPHYLVIELMNSIRDVVFEGLADELNHKITNTRQTYDLLERRITDFFMYLAQNHHLEDYDVHSIWDLDRLKVSIGHSYQRNEVNVNISLVGTPLISCRPCDITFDCDLCAFGPRDDCVICYGECRRMPSKPELEMMVCAIEHRLIMLTNTQAQGRQLKRIERAIRKYTRQLNVAQAYLSNPDSPTPRINIPQLYNHFRSANNIQFRPVVPCPSTSRVQTSAQTWELDCTLHAGHHGQHRASVPDPVRGSFEMQWSGERAEFDYRGGTCQLCGTFTPPDKLGHLCSAIIPPESSVGRDTPNDEGADD